MFLLTLCLIGFAAAAPAIPDAPKLADESHMLVAPYIAYAAPLAPFRALEIKIEPEPKEENAELPEPKEELPEPEELLTEPEEPKPEEPKPTVVKLDIPKPPQFMTNLFNSVFPFSLSNLPYISNWINPNPANAPKILYPAYYPAYPGPVIVEATKP